MQPFEFGVAVAQMSRRRFAKQADVFQNMKDMGGNLATGLNQSWNNGARAFKGMTGAVGAGLGAAAAGVGTGGMLIGNAAGSLVGKKPFSNESVNTMAGVAGNYANVAKGYGKDFATSMGLASDGEAGSLTNNHSYGDEAWKHVENAPGVTHTAQNVSQMGRTALQTASNLAPAAAIGTAAKMLAPAGGHGAATATTAGPAAPQTGNMVSNAMQAGQRLGRQSGLAGTIDRGRQFAHDALHTVDQMGEHNNPLGVGVHVARNTMNPSAPAGH
jgi:hypothetical protein